MTETRTLDYRPRLDERNRAYRLTAPDPSLLQRSRYWTPGYPVLDQGAEGACVGFGCTGEAMASPVRVKTHIHVTTPDGQTRELTAQEAATRVAQAVYHRALQIDEFEGERDEGTSVRAGMLVGRERGWWSGFRWAFNMLDLRAALEEGPVVIGVEWRSGMYDAADGLLVPNGGVVGGHCILVTGYTPDHRPLRISRSPAPAYRLSNSWSSEWGRNGSAYIHSDDLDMILFQAGGEAAVPVGRAL